MGDVQNNLDLYFPSQSRGETLLSAAANTLFVAVTGARDQ